jgi:hypothetical protein
VPWGRIKEIIGESLPDTIIDRERILRACLRRGCLSRMEGCLRANDTRPT